MSLYEIVNKSNITATYNYSARLKLIHDITKITKEDKACKSRQKKLVCNNANYSPDKNFNKSILNSSNSYFHYLQSAK